jgi:hypothetical protein
MVRVGVLLLVVVYQEGGLARTIYIHGVYMVFLAGQLPDIR